MKRRQRKRGRDEVSFKISKKVGGGKVEAKRRLITDMIYENPWKIKALEQIRRNKAWKFQFWKTSWSMRIYQIS